MWKGCARRDGESPSTSTTWLVAEGRCLVRRLLVSASVQAAARAGRQVSVCFRGKDNTVVLLQPLQGSPRYKWICTSRAVSACTVMTPMLDHVSTVISSSSTSAWSCATFESVGSESMSRSPKCFKRAPLSARYRRQLSISSGTKTPSSVTNNG